MFVSFYFYFYFNMSHINGINMWPKVYIDDMLPSPLKKGLGRPRKLGFREHDDNNYKRRRSRVSYMCTKCDKYEHN